MRQDPHGINSAPGLGIKDNSPARITGSSTGSTSAAEQALALAQQGLVTVSGLSAPIRLQGGASVQQLKLLAAAFKLCPHPTEAQIDAVARRVSLTSDRLDAWFRSRRTLQDWVMRQPHLDVAELAATFYPAVEV